MSEHSANSSKINYFQRCWDAGYHNLLPVVPPWVGMKNAGKRPGVLNGGVWVGRGSKEFVATAETIGLWHEMGASVGLLCNDGLTGVDIDTLTPRWADHITGLAHEMLGPAPRRVGRAPKVLLPYSCPAAMKYAQVKFRDDEMRLATAHGRHVVDGPSRRPGSGVVEVLAGDGQWFVAFGVHPQTRRPYEWLDDLPPRSELTDISVAARDAFLERLRAELPEGRKQLSGQGEAIAPEFLRGDLDMIAEAMRAMPNDPDVVGYKQWIEMAIALHGAVDDYDKGLELFQEFSEKAGFSPDDEGYESPHKAFASISHARRLGADYIYDHAEKAGWSRRVVDRWFVDRPEDEATETPYESIFGPGEETPGQTIAATPWEWLDPRSIPPRDFLYGTHIVRRFASMTVAPSKVGKSSLATVDVLAMVTGRTLLPRMKPKGALRVWYINGEDPLEELQRRIAAAMLRYQIVAADVGDRLFVDSGRSLRLVTAIEDRQGVRILRPVIEALVAELRSRAIDVLVVDPFVSTHQVGENDNNGIDMIMTEWIMAADRAGCAVEFIHHARKAGVGADPDASIDAARGATSLVAKMRSVRALAKMTKTQAKQLGLTTAYRNLFRVTDASSNLAPWVDDETEWMKLENVDLGNGLGEDDATRWSEGDHVAVVVAWSFGSSDDRVDIGVVLQELGAAEWREDARGEDWVGKPVAIALNLDLNEPDDKASVKRMLGKWLKDGLLERVKMKDRNRNTRWYVKVRNILE